MVLLVSPEDSTLPDTLPGLPPNYNFELAKTVRTIRRHSAKKITMQFPDGLLSYAPTLIDFFEATTGVRCTILDDVVYGACCVDDTSIDSDLLIHYGHSCLVPVTEMATKVLYVFVDIKIDISHLKKILCENFTEPVALIGTIQFNRSIHRLKRMFKTEAEGASACVLSIPQVRPLSPGEVLGCTSPVISENSVVYVGDGRFHLESAMIRNPTKEFYKYCPMTRRMTKELYDYHKMLRMRQGEISRADQAQCIGVIQGTLGRQGSSKIVEKVVGELKKRNKRVYRIVMAEISAAMLDNYGFIDAFVQVSCPRLSIDWGTGYSKPLLTPFEIFYSGTGPYEMDYYSETGRNPWQNYQ